MYLRLLGIWLTADMAIPSKYAEHRERLRELIRQGAIQAAEALSRPNACYFCLKPIKTTCWELIEKDSQGTSSYCIDDGCYREARNNFYVHETPFPAN